jgi:hypothetical protein
VAARKRYDPEQFVDVDFDDFVRDAVATIESIYDRFGLALTDEARQAIGDSHAESEVGERRPAHRYRLSDFGLTERQVAARFAAYLEEFGS